MTPRIRPAHREDTETIQSLARDIWPKVYGNMISAAQMEYMLNWMYSNESLAHQIESGHQFLLLEAEPDFPIGYASYRRQDDHIWKLEKLYVRAENHGLGLGKILLENILDSIRAAGGKALELQVNRANPAVQFYHKMGFEILREVDFEIGNGFYMNDYIMCRFLDGSNAI